MVDFGCQKYTVAILRDFQKEKSGARFLIWELNEKNLPFRKAGVYAVKIVVPNLILYFLVFPCFTFYPRHASLDILCRFVIFFSR